MEILEQQKTLFELFCFTKFTLEQIVHKRIVRHIYKNYCFKKISHLYFYLSGSPFKNKDSEIK